MTNIENRTLTPRSIVQIDLSRISPSPYQPRRAFSEASIRELADSIRQYGLLSPLLLRRVDAGRYELIAGERRYRAMQMLHFTQADAIVLSAFDADCALISLVENLQREQLHFLEEADACRALMEEHGFTQEALSRLIGKSVPAIANKLRLLKLPSSVREMLPSSGLSERHARALLKLEDESMALNTARLAAEQRMSVRQLEEYIARLLSGTKKKQAARLPCFRDNRFVINAVLDTVRELNRLGVHANARVEPRDQGVDVIVSIRGETAPFPNAAEPSPSDCRSASQ